LKPILLLGEFLHRADALTGQGFTGPPGVELIKLLSEAGVLSLTPADKSSLSRYYNSGDTLAIAQLWSAHPEFARAQVFHLHTPTNKLEHFCGPKSTALPGYPKLGTAGWVRAEFGPQLDRLGDDILALDPNLIICLGNAAMWALSGRTGVSKLRGTTFLSTQTVADYKCLIANHPASINNQWELRPVTILDLAKATRENLSPELLRPECTIWIEPTLDDIETFYHDHIIGCEILSTDIETSGTRITCIGFAPRHDLAIVIPFDDDRKPDRNYWATQEDERHAWDIIRRILADRTVPKVFQNGLYDIAFLLRAYGIPTYSAAEDTMLLHHALSPESLKGLAFLGSVYTDHGPWKSERKGTSTTIKKDA